MVLERLFAKKQLYCSLKQVLIESQGRIKKIELYESTAINNIHPLTMNTYEDALNYIKENYSPGKQYCNGVSITKKKRNENLVRIIFNKRNHRNSIPFKTLIVKFSMKK